MKEKYLPPLRERIKDTARDIVKLLQDPITYSNTAVDNAKDAISINRYRNTMKLVAGSMLEDRAKWKYNNSIGLFERTAPTDLALLLPFNEPIKYITAHLAESKKDIIAALPGSHRSIAQTVRELTGQHITDIHGGYMFSEKHFFAKPTVKVYGTSGSFGQANHLSTVTSLNTHAGKYLDATLLEQD